MGKDPGLGPRCMGMRRVSVPAGGHEMPLKPEVTAAVCASQNSVGSARSPHGGGSPLLCPDVLAAVLVQLHGEGAVRELGKVARACHSFSAFVRSPALGSIWVAEGMRVFPWYGLGGAVPAARGFDEYCRWRDIEGAQRGCGVFQEEYDEGVLAGLALQSFEEAYATSTSFELCMELELRAGDDGRRGRTVFLARTSEEGSDITMPFAFGDVGTEPGPGTEGEPGEPIMAGFFNVMRYDRQADADEEWDTVGVVRPPCDVKLLLRRDDGRFAALGCFSMDACDPGMALSEAYPECVMVSLDRRLGYFCGLVCCTFSMTFKTDRNKEGEDTLHCFQWWHDIWERVFTADNVASGGALGAYKGDFYPRWVAAMGGLEWR